MGSQTRKHESSKQPLHSAHRSNIVTNDSGLIMVNKLHDQL